MKTLFTHKYVVSLAWEIAPIVIMLRSKIKNSSRQREPKPTGCWIGKKEFFLSN